MKVDEVLRSVVSRAGVVRVRNAMNPLLWLSAATAPIGLIGVYLFRDDPVLRYAFFGLEAVPIFASVIAYFLYFVFDRDRLQSEEFVIEQRKLEMIYRRRESAEVVDPAREVARTEILPDGFRDRGKS